MAGIQLSNVASVLLPPEITQPIFLKTAEQSAVMRMARKVPLAVNAQTAIPIPMDVPTADWVSEGGVKPVGTEGTGVKIMNGKKVAVLVPVSQEVVMSNPAGLYDQLASDLPLALGRGFDYAAIHGASLRNPAAGAGTGPFTDYLAATSNQQVIGASAASAGGVYNDLWSGIKQIVNSATQPYDFTGFAADKRLIPELAMSYDTQGHPLFSANGFVGQNTGTPTSTAGLGNIVGFDAAFSNGVSGKYYRQGNGVQVVTVNGSPTGGTFTLSLAGQTTGPIAYNAAGSVVQTALQALLGGIPGAQTTNPYGITVTGSGPYTVTFSGPANYITGNGKNLTGGTTPSVTTAQATNLDSGLRAIGGDWTQCAWGQGMDITIKVSDVASYVDAGGTTHSAFQENLVLLLAEAYYGFVVADANAFVAYTHAAGS